MKVIQWYPGHMAKAMRMMEENLTLCDAAVCVLDARAPASTYNPRLAALAGTRPVLFVLAKGDLSDGRADVLLAALKTKRAAVKIDALAPSSARVLRSAIAELLAEKIEKRREKGLKKPLRLLVAGVPNTGKSTVINLLAGGKKAQTGDKAGVTRAKQWVKCGDFELLDSPGVMPPSCEDQRLARRLAYLGCLNDDTLALDEIALSLLGEMSERYPMSLKERYGRGEGAPLELLDAVCAKRGFLLRGGDYDYERGVRAAIDDLRKGKFGKVCFDNADDLVGVGLLEG